MYNLKLKAIRERNGFTQIQISNILGISSSRYGHYECEDDTIPIKYLNDLVNYFDVSFDYIFDFTNNKNYKNAKKSIDTNIVSLRLKEFRKENKLTQIKLANILNVVKGTIGNYESGRNLIATPFLYDICKKYKISADYLLGKTDAPKYLN